MSIAWDLYFWWYQSIYHPNQYDLISWSSLSSNKPGICSCLPCWRVLLKFGGKTAWQNPIGPETKLSRLHRNKWDCLWHSMWYYQFIRRAGVLSTSIYQDRKHIKSEIWGAIFSTFVASEKKSEKSIWAAKTHWYMQNIDIKEHQIMRRDRNAI